MRRQLELVVNGEARRLELEDQRSLLSVLRDDLGLYGAKYGCGEGHCGACTVLVDGVPRRSCTTQVGTVAGKEITTVEGLEHDGKLHPVQQAFLEEEAFQCGYCTCGMIMGACGLLRRNPRPTAAQIRTFLDGHLCRCGTYQRIVAAVQRASRLLQGAQP
ncbi:MAG: oxidoreductase [Pirellulaceae bacterium]|nr:MAG: oxidoreductase [Pirellulaceae bacterium]